MDESDLIAGVRAIVAKVLGTTDPNSIGPSDDLIVYGLDSLKFAELNDALFNEFGVHPLGDSEPLSIESLVQHIRQSVRDRDSRIVASDSRPSVLDATGLPPRILLHPVTESPRISLALDDLVPASILLVVAYDGDISGQLIEAIQYGLDAFPHLAGRLDGNADPFQMSVVPSDAGVLVESRSASQISMDDLWRFSNSQFVDRLMPTSSRDVADQILESPLLAARVTSIAQGASVLGLLVSHVLLDGVGLGLFLQHCICGINHVAAPQPNHSRSVLTRESGENARLPDWYLIGDHPVESQREWRIARHYGLSVFTVAESDVCQRFPNGKSNAWFQLTALLCDQLKCSGFTEAAFWCDVRGSLAIPRSYTGNVGCYWHEPLRQNDESLDEFAQRLRMATQLDKTGRIAETYTALKHAEQQGQPVCWTGTEPHVLPVNLVPYSASAMDFGQGSPTFARILTRNVHGIRISRVPGRQMFMVEACLPGDTIGLLTERCQSQGLPLRSLCLEL